ncbi:hypothetical protein ACFW7J_16485 [Streptomyces sp. NPDC059525]
MPPTLPGAKVSRRLRRSSRAPARQHWAVGGAYPAPAAVADLPIRP